MELTEKIVSGVRVRGAESTLPKDAFIAIHNIYGRKQLTHRFGETFAIPISRVNKIRD